MCFHYRTNFSLLMASSDSKITMQEKVFLVSAAITYDSASRAIKEYEDSIVKRLVEQQFSIGKITYGQREAYCQERRLEDHQTKM